LLGNQPSRLNQSLCGLLRAPSWTVIPSDNDTTVRARLTGDVGETLTPQTATDCAGSVVPWWPPVHRPACSLRSASPASQEQIALPNARHRDPGASLGRRASTVQHDGMRLYYVHSGATESQGRRFIKCSSLTDDWTASRVRGSHLGRPSFARPGGESGPLGSCIEPFRPVVRVSFADVTPLSGTCGKMAEWQNGGTEFFSTRFAPEHFRPGKRFCRLLAPAGPWNAPSFAVLPARPPVKLVSLPGGAWALHVLRRQRFPSRRREGPLHGGELTGGSI
jgi:hypothetical protein